MKKDKKRTELLEMLFQYQDSAYRLDFDPKKAVKECNFNKLLPIIERST